MPFTPPPNPEQLLEKLRQDGWAKSEQQCVESRHCWVLIGMVYL